MKSPLNSLPLSLSSRSRRQPAAFSSRATRRASLLVWRAVGLPSWRRRALPRQRMSGCRSRSAARSRPWCLSIARCRSSRSRPARRAARPRCAARGLDRVAAIGRGVAGDQPVALARVLSPCRQSTFQTPLGETMIPPHFSRASSRETRLGPSPGMGDREAQMRSSTIRESWLGICGLRRSRGRRISSP